MRSIQNVFQNLKFHSFSAGHTPAFGSRFEHAEHSNMHNYNQ